MTTVVLDAMGGDHAPGIVLGGARRSLEKGLLQPQQLILAGPVDRLRPLLAEHGLPADLAIVNAPDVLAGDETPVDALRRKPNNSITIGINLLKDKRADAFVSAGHTGVVVATAQVALRRLEGIRRPGIAVTIEGEGGPFVVVDVGANPQPRARDLLDYAIMGAAYFKDTFAKPVPRVGLMNIGSEDAKGNPLAREAAALLREAEIEFVGNVEGVDVYSGRCDVVVSDGFTGNVLLKVSEGVAEYMLRSIKKLMQEADVSSQKMDKVLATLQRRVDYSEYGGALLLGIDGIVTICHGRSDERAICNAVKFAIKAVDAHVNQHIVVAARNASSGSPEGQA